MRRRLQDDSTLLEGGLGTSGESTGASSLVHNYNAGHSWQTYDSHQSLMQGSCNGHLTVQPLRLSLNAS